MTPTTIWQIWRSLDGCEECVLPNNSPQHTRLARTVDDGPMQLIHEYLVEGDPESAETVERALQYSKKWRFNEGEWPEGCKAKDGA